MVQEQYYQSEYDNSKCGTPRWMHCIAVDKMALIATVDNSEDYTISREVGKENNILSVYKRWWFISIHRTCAWDCRFYL